MSLSDLASLGSFVSGVAVLISLVYLALQVRQSRQHTAAQISQARVHAGMQNQELYIQGPGVPDLVLRVAQGGGDMTDADWMRFHFLLSNSFVMVEDEFRQFKAGLISAERHNGFVRRFSASFQNPAYRAAWTMQREGFEPDFRAFMDSLVQQARESGGAVRNWSEMYHVAIAAELKGQPLAQPAPRS
ncbi:MAG TPA: hypothetical protein VMU08_08140 [Rhizomicrobium sp.]|nr:hypothetical protein [Rhizomicrobium sp.]